VKPQDVDSLRTAISKKIWKALGTKVGDAKKPLRDFLGDSEAEINTFLLTIEESELRSWVTPTSSGQLPNILERSRYLDQARFQVKWNEDDLKTYWQDHNARTKVQGMRSKCKAKARKKCFLIKVDGTPGHVGTIGDRIAGLSPNVMQEVLHLPGVAGVAATNRPKVFIAKGPKVKGSGHWVKGTIHYEDYKLLNFPNDTPKDPSPCYQGKGKFRFLLTSITLDGTEGPPVLCMAYNTDGIESRPYKGVTQNPVTNWKKEDDSGTNVPEDHFGTLDPDAHNQLETTVEVAEKTFAVSGASKRSDDGDDNDPEMDNINALFK
jgi:hypothetical protein